MCTHLQSRMPKILAALTIGMLIAGSAKAQGNYTRRQNDPIATQIDSWYLRYLHRYADPTGLKAWGDMLRQGSSALEVQAGILGSEEYYRNHANDPGQFITGLYNDVLGRNPSHTQVGAWLDEWDRVGGNRELLAREFLRRAERESREDWDRTLPNRRDREWR